MGSTERIKKLKMHTRKNILDAALQIVKQDGWAALSMRRTAGLIDYTAPIIYEYFGSKEALIGELIEGAMLKLSNQLSRASKAAKTPLEKISSMWLVYWEFAFREKALYKAMFGIQVDCNEHICAGLDKLCSLFLPLIKAMGIKTGELIRWYRRYWSSVHGLISLSLLYPDEAFPEDRAILIDAVEDLNKQLQFAGQLN